MTVNVSMAESGKFDRHSLLQKGQCVSVVGPRLIGKSSLLLHLADTNVQVQHGLYPDRYSFVYTDCRNWTDLPADDLYGILLDNLQDSLTTSHRELLPAAGERGPPHCRALEHAVLNAAEHGLRLVFMIDHFEAVAGLAGRRQRGSPSHSRSGA